MTEPQETSSDPLEQARERARHDRDYARDLEGLAGVLGPGVKVEPERVGDRLVTDVGWDLQLQGRKGTS